ncbi:putative tRNA threonylcarbamoyladenosine biosynthesis protein kae1 [Hypoxylon texense]
MVHATSRAALAVAGLVAKLKLACAALIGIVAGCMLHGTSSVIFVLLGVDASSQKRRSEQGGSELPPLEDEEQDYDDLDSGVRSGDSSSWVSTSSLTSAPRPSKSKRPKDGAQDMLEKQWKLLRSSEKPKRRRRGLLAQTIHEESSSDFS